MTREEYDKVFKLPFNEASKFFRQKLNIPTEVWTDLWQGEHAKGFMSAGAYHADLLSDLRKMTQKAIDGGMDIREFRKQFKPLVEKYGWELKGGGPAWRSDLIFRTNISTAYAAGRWQQFETAGIKYLRYVHADGIRHPRPRHQAMHGIVRPIGDVFWNYNYPPQGFRCHCRAEPVDAAEYAATPANLKQLPSGYDAAADEGWRYNVGKEGQKGYEALTRKFESLPVDIAQKWMNGFLQSPTFERFYQQKIPANFPVAVLDPKDQAALGAKSQTVWFSPQSLEEHLKKHPDITLEDYRKIQMVLEDGEVYQNLEKPERLTYLMIDGKLYRAGVKTTGDKEENFFLTLFETTEEVLKRQDIRGMERIR